MPEKTEPELELEPVNDGPFPSKPSPQGLSPEALTNTQFMKRVEEEGYIKPEQSPIIQQIIEALADIKKRVDKAIKETNLPDETKDGLKALTEYFYIFIVLFLGIGSAFGWISISPVYPWVIMDVTMLGILATALATVLLYGQLKKRGNKIIAGKEKKNREQSLEIQALKSALNKSVEPSL